MRSINRVMLLYFVPFVWVCWISTESQLWQYMKGLRILKTTSTQAKGDGDARVYSVAGTTQISQTRFGISPPSVMFGAIKVQDEVRVEWKLVYQRKSL